MEQVEAFENREGIVDETGVAVENLASEKSAEKRSRQDAIQTTFSVFLDIIYPPNLAVWDEKRVFQQPRDFTTTIMRHP